MFTQMPLSRWTWVSNLWGNLKYIHKANKEFLYTQLMAVHFLFQMWRFSLFQGRSVVFSWKLEFICSKSSLFGSIRSNMNVLPTQVKFLEHKQFCLVQGFVRRAVCSPDFKVSPAECRKLNRTESTSLLLWLITVLYRVGSSGCKSNTKTLTGQCRTTCAFPSGMKGPRWAETLFKRTEDKDEKVQSHLSLKKMQEEHVVIVKGWLCW